MPFFFILLLGIVFLGGPLVMVMLLEKRKVSIPKIALITSLIPAFSIVGLILDHKSLITNTHSLSGDFGFEIMYLNLIGTMIAGWLFRLLPQDGYTWNYWITAIILNWLALIALAVIFRQVILRPRLQRVINTTFQIAAFLYFAYMAVKNFPSVMESIRYLRGQ